MAESAEDRKKRLKELREARDAARSAPPEKKIKFRNYLPQSAELAANFERPEGEREGGGDEEDEEDAAAPAPATSAYKEELEKIAAADAAVSIVAKDPNWDLKRDIEPKLAILAKRTQNAIVEIIRERLAAENDPAS